MNLFRLLGDLSHLGAIIILLLKMWKSRSCSGISGRSQILFALVFITRYLDLFTSYISLYNTFMKIFFLTSSIGTCYLMYFKFRATYNHNHDTFRIEFLLVPAVILSLILNHGFEFTEILWTFSIYLESVAILPQLFMIQKIIITRETLQPLQNSIDKLAEQSVPLIIESEELNAVLLKEALDQKKKAIKSMSKRLLKLQKTGEAETITSHYLFALGSYRGLYILNWIYRYYSEGFYDIIAIVAGCIQTILYCDFFYLYVTKVLKGQRLQLPA